MLLDNFNRNPPDPSPITGGWSEIATGGNLGEIESNRLRINSNTNTNEATANFVYRDVSTFYNTTLSANSDVLTWAFNMRQTVPDPNGFNTGNSDGIAFVLGVKFWKLFGADIIGVDPRGYAVVLGEPNPPNPYNRVRLVHIDGEIGNNAITDIISTGTHDYSNEYLSVRVTYNPAGNLWSLYVESDPAAFPQTDPRQTNDSVRTNIVNEKYINDNLKYLGMDWHRNKSATNFAIFDDVYIPYNFNSFYRSVQSGNWDATSTWEMSVDNVTWQPAAVAPTALANTITIRNTHTVQITAPVSIDQTVVAAGGTLVVSNPATAFTLQNGPGDDLEIQSGGTYVHGSSAPVPTLNLNSIMRMKAGSTLRVDNNASGQADWYATNESNTIQSRMIWENGSIFHWNTSQPFNTDNISFFPNVTSEIPILKITTTQSVGSAGATFVNGILEADANVSWSGAGVKTFRNGIRGSGNITQEASSGSFQITGPSAELSGEGNLLLNASGLQIQAATVTVRSAKTITAAVPSTVALNLGSIQQLGGSGTLTFGDNLTLNVQNNVSLSGNWITNGTLNLTNGILQTNTHTVTLGPTAQLSETETARIVGNVTTTRTLAQGVNHDFGGLGLEINAAGAAPGSTTVTRVTGPAAVRTDGSGNQSIQRYFTISPTTDTGLDATLAFHYFDAEVVSLDFSLILFRSFNNGVTWLDEQGVVDPSTNTITRTGIPTFTNQWTAADANNPLPVSLQSFSGYRVDNSIKLAWSTVKEMNNARFEVQRSANLKEFVVIGYVKATQQPQAVNHYTFTDENYRQAGYYRLKQLDQDGQYELSKPIFVEAYTFLTLDGLLLYPNPTLGKIYLSLPDITSANFTLLSSKGIPLASFTALPTDADARLSELLLALPAGMYFLQTSQGNQTYQNKLIKY